MPTGYTSGQVAGISVPQLTGDQVEAMTTTTLKAGTLVYATAASGAATKDVSSVGYWYWTGDATKKWEPLGSGGGLIGPVFSSFRELAFTGGTITINPTDYIINITSDTSSDGIVGLPTTGIEIGRTICITAPTTAFINLSMRGGQQPIPAGFSMCAVYTGVGTGADQWIMTH